MRLLSMLRGLIRTAAVILSATAPAYAVAVSDQLIVTTPAGGRISLSAPEDPLLEGPGHFFAITLPMGALNLALLGQPTAVLDPDGSVSDLIGICHSCSSAGPALAFLSDGSVPLQLTDFDGAYPLFFRSGETVPISVTLYLSPGYTAEFTSDVDVEATVPEPGALPLFATGLGLMALLAWHRRRQAAAQFGAAA